MLIILMEVHAVGQHFLEVANFYGEVRSEVLAVNLETGRVLIHEAPDLDLLYEELEVCSGLPMERLVFLHGVDGHHQQVRSTHDVALETHVEWVLSLEVSVDAIKSDPDLLVIMSDVERPDRVVL